ncbi:hypothetical protein [Cryobacterium sp. SO1]|uniref:hypothetical protein n=1 Tax=Cryobacterium sp. SO1 TaxID=1897061 RepID=UPI001023EA98|nr:hypothetical protein [Cryobacterium sp. SO1]
MNDVLSGALPLWYAAELIDLLPNGCMYKREIGGRWAWTDDQQLMVAMHHQQAIANWQGSVDGSKNRNQPKPAEPPRGRYEVEIQTDAIYDRVKRHEEAVARRAQRQHDETTTEQ